MGTGWKNADDLVGHTYRLETVDGIIRTATITRVHTHVFEIDGLPATTPVGVELGGDSLDMIDFARLRSLRKIVVPTRSS